MPRTLLHSSRSRLSRGQLEATGVGVGAARRGNRGSAAIAGRPCQRGECPWAVWVMRPTWELRSAWAARSPELRGRLWVGHRLQRTLASCSAASPAARASILRERARPCRMASTWWAFRVAQSRSRFSPSPESGRREIETNSSDRRSQFWEICAPSCSMKSVVVPS